MLMTLTHDFERCSGGQRNVCRVGQRVGQGAIQDMRSLLAAVIGGVYTGQLAAGGMCGMRKYRADGEGTGWGENEVWWRERESTTKILRPENANAVTVF